MSGSPPLPRPALDFAYRFRRLGGGSVVLTDEAGRFVVLGREEFDRLRNGDIDDVLESRMAEAGFGEVSLGHCRRCTRRHHPSRHVVVVDRGRPSGSAAPVMTRDTALRTLDLVFDTAGPALSLELAGDDPLRVFELTRELVEEARARSVATGKELEVVLVSDLSHLDEERFAWLVADDVSVRVRVRGAACLDFRTLHWASRLRDEVGSGRLEAEIVVTPSALGLAERIVDAYASVGCHSIILSRSDTPGAETEVGGEDYLDFYRRATDRLIALNERGYAVSERLARRFLSRVFAPEAAHDGCGAREQLAYDVDGSVFACEAGRHLALDGDDHFRLGTVDVPAESLLKHRRVRSLEVAENPDTRPECAHCAYRRYCHVCPVYNQRTQGSVFGQMWDNELCAIHMGILDHFFQHIQEGTPEVLRVLETWGRRRKRAISGTRRVAPGADAAE